MTKTELSKDLLVKNGINVEFDSNGQPIIKHNNSPVRQVIITREHKYGKDLSYAVVHLTINNKQYTAMVSNIVYVYCNDSVIPKGYDVDHIDNDSLNNKLDNLQLLTRKENLAKRPSGQVNQHSCNMTEEEKLNCKLKREESEHNRFINKLYMTYYKMFLDNIEKALDENKLMRQLIEYKIENSGDCHNRARLNRRIVNEIIPEKKRLNALKHTRFSDFLEIGMNPPTFKNGKKFL